MPDQKIDPSTSDLARIDFHPHWTKEQVRFVDIDLVGHANNAVFSSFLESGRVTLLYNPQKPLAPAGTSFVIVRLALDFLAEIQWPNEVLIGTTVMRLGTSSITFGQGIFVKDRCTAIAETVIVLMNLVSRKAHPLPEQSRAELSKWLAPQQ